MSSAEPQKLISVIIPVYNVAPFLDACLNSVLGQNYSRMEVLVIDDASTDDSAAVIREYAQKDSRIVPIYHQLNQGAWAARNSGLKAATGDYVSFLDGDDCWEPEFLNTMSSELSRQSDHCEGVFCWSRNVDVYGKPTGKTNQPRAGSYFLADMLIGICPPRNGSALMLRRRCFAQVGEFAAMSGMDSEMWLRIAAQSEQSCFQCVPEMLVQYRQRPGSLSKQSPDLRLESLRYRLDKYLGKISPDRWWEVYVSFMVYALTLQDACVSTEVKRWSRMALRRKYSLVWKESGFKTLFVALFGYESFAIAKRLKHRMES